MLTTIDDGIYCDYGPVRPVGMRISVTMSLLRLDDGSLLVHSPLPLTDERRTEVTALGRVAHLYAPNTFHHQWLGDWIGAFPNAVVHAPSELRTKRPDLRIDRFHDQADDAPFAGVAEVPIRGFRLRETALVHHAARAVVVADLVSNVGRPEHLWTKLYSKGMGFYDRVALSRLLRWTTFDDYAAARISTNALLARDFDILVVGHGAPVLADARDVLADATAWLPVSAPSLPRGEGAQARWWNARPCG